MNEQPTSLPARRGFLLARLFGIEVRLDWSLAIIFLLVTINLGAGVLPAWHPAWGAVGVWVGAAIASVLLFCSLLAHEMSHALVARTQGVEVNTITLFLFGGVAHLEGEPPSPKAEFLIAAVGPLTSFVIGSVLTGLGVWIAGPQLELMRGASPEETVALFAGMGPGVTLLLWLGPLNLILGAFNLVPGFPLDGGRVLRAFLWAVTKDQLKATKWASYAGQLVGFSMIAWGVLGLMRGNIGGGLWLMLIGWFVNGAARGSYRQQLFKHSLEAVPVSKLMNTRLDRVWPTLTLDDFVRDHVMQGDQTSWPVEEDGVLLGLATFDDVRKVSRDLWPVTQVGQIMTPASQLSTLPPEAGAEKALEELSKREVENLPVLDHGHLLGLIRRKDLLRWLTLHASDPTPG